MKVNRRFLTILKILLVAIIGGILVILMNIARDQQPIEGWFFMGNSTQLMMTNDWVNTAVSATGTAKSYTATPTKQP